MLSFWDFVSLILAWVLTFFGFLMSGLVFLNRSSGGSATEGSSDTGNESADQQVLL